MFTGIIEEQGTIKALQRQENLLIIKVETQKIHRGTRIGDSIAVDGVCLTVMDIRKRILSFEVMKETILKTTLRDYQLHRRVNLERALRAGDRLGGHFVTGHIDGVGTIEEKRTKPHYVELEIRASRNLLRYIVPKGSVCVDGISLTVGRVKPELFTVYLIPHTLKVTSLGQKRPRDKVNIETDILAKYLLSQKS
jgi:riboflavin synthase